MLKHEVDEFFGAQEDENDYSDTELNVTRQKCPHQTVQNNNICSTAATDCITSIAKKNPSDSIPLVAEEGGLMSMHEQRYVERTFRTHGYHEAFETSKNMNLQRGFEDGYTSSFREALHLGELLGQIVTKDAWDTQSDNDGTSSTHAAMIVRNFLETHWNERNSNTNLDLNSNLEQKIDPINDLNAVVKELEKINDEVQY
mmetsp:Transcript_14197/g.20274  ORF Transcript_14197/g.20274 Transcript_14197/m.20274 type:complete len:200 (-) Transcript_14197:207-806(-)